MLLDYGLPTSFFPLAQLSLHTENVLFITRSNQQPKYEAGSRTTMAHPKPILNDLAKWKKGLTHWFWTQNRIKLNTKPGRNLQLSIFVLHILIKNFKAQFLSLVSNTTKAQFKAQ